MRVFAIAADVIMGAILGLFLFVVVRDAWPAANHPAAAVVIFAVSIGLALFRRRIGGGSTAVDVPRRR